MGFPFKEEDAKIKLKSLNDGVVLKRLEPEAVRNDGILVPGTAEEKFQGCLISEAPEKEKKPGPPMPPGEY